MLTFTETWDDADTESGTAKSLGVFGSGPVGRDDNIVVTSVGGTEAVV